MEKVQKDADGGKLNKNGKKKQRRSRQRVDRPKQTYLYAAQREALERSGVVLQKKKKKNLQGEEDVGDDGDEEEDEEEEVARAGRVNDKDNPITIARNLGLNPASQACDASFAVVETGITSSSDDESSPFNKVITVDEPRIVGQLRVGDSDSGSGMFAYIIEKPPGWSILEGAKKKKKAPPPVVEKSKKERKQNQPEKVSKKGYKRTKYYDEEADGFDVMEYDETGMLSVMTPEEIEEFEKEGGFEGMDLSDVGASAAKTAVDAFSSFDDDGEIEAMVDDARSKGSSKKIDPIDNSASDSNHGPAVFAPETRPSVVSWLKDLKSAEGTPIRGGKFWTGIAGAIEVDDSGLIILCPKDQVENLYVDNAQYTAIVGNGRYFAPKGKKKQVLSSRSMASLDQAKIDVVAKLRKGRMKDIVLTAEIRVPDGASTTNDVVQICQKELNDGIRGDPNANPLDRRANRRLVHCSSISVSSLSYDDVVETDVEVPGDIRMLSDRRNHHEYSSGSFLGRNGFKENGSTTAYREVNGAADGFPGWLVDRYDRWLFVQHDEDYVQGPLPSLHDGSTAGVYYFSTEKDRSVTGAKKGIKPKLMEGQPAPEVLPIKENGITYHVNFDDLSTGIFLDQRSQRAWLSRFCTQETKVLNCFSHCGAFSIAAATAGAETTSLDLDKKWLDRVGPQLRANGIDDSDGRHDCIYGDCKLKKYSSHNFVRILISYRILLGFDWLRRLGKRGDKFDVVIVDPPSTSVGGKKKKRWSAKNDYAELVELAAPLVKEGGLLWTTTNSNQIQPVRFARMCKKGLVSAGLPNSKLERVAAMPSDFPSIGPQAVKNL